MRIAYHASHEQFDPHSLLEYAQLAESAGFQAAMCSDHFSPWSERQGNSGFAFSWLGAALQATHFSFGTVSAPGQRYHPAIVAQAAATLAQMYPGRFWLALGSGELLNEHITGDRWPAKEPRQQRLRECVDVMRALRRRSGHARWVGALESGEAIREARRPSPAVRGGIDARDGDLGRRVGGRPHHRARLARAGARDH